MHLTTGTAEPLHLSIDTRATELIVTPTGLVKLSIEHTLIKIKNRM